MADRQEVMKVLDELYACVEDLLNENEKFDNEIYNLNETLSARKDYIDVLNSIINGLDKELAAKWN